MDDVLFAHVYQGVAYFAYSVAASIGCYIGGYLFTAGALWALRVNPIKTKSNFDGTWRTGG